VPKRGQSGQARPQETQKFKGQNLKKREWRNSSSDTLRSTVSEASLWGTRQRRLSERPEDQSSRGKKGHSTRKKGIDENSQT